MQSETFWTILIIVCGIQLYRHTRLGLLAILVAPVFAVVLSSLLHYLTHDFFAIRWKYKHILNFFILGLILFFPDWKKIDVMYLLRTLSSFLTQKGKENKEKLVFYARALSFF